jgi:DNA polymerase-3 subunit delta'
MQFKEVIGQEDIKHKIIQQIKEDKISHAQLFIGNAGFGTLPMALAFAQYIFCENKNDLDSCGECPSCRKVSAFQHADLHFYFPVIQEDKNKISKGKTATWTALVKADPYMDLDKWSNDLGENKKPIISVSEAIEIINEFNLKSYEGGFKIGIVWMAQTMNVQCANKLLKLLEEPTPNTLFIMITDQEEFILPTIRSRTQVTRFPRIQSSAVSEYFIKQKNYSPNNATNLSILANGDINNVKKQFLNLTEESEEEILYKRYSEAFMQLMRVCYKKDVNGMLDWVEMISNKPFSKNHQKQFVLYAIQMMRQSMLKNYTGDQLLNVNEEEAKFLVNFAKFITGNNIFEFIDMFDQAYYHLDRNANAKILFNDLCFNVMRYIRKA